ncbi:MAG: hypothetical protein A2806_01230 [Candidatus Terrybacteria bacterium RIFCSPHIGHO2_01_FULL_48_17]|uniref:LTD domain-containing protein n=1 Tax=Candidatus Terrybacteria bacterium RIFCSPHIGHO2_01_FULL_48_17 TaxID=1802362 RepID=A0A1G2PK80_9BACT|nr:MAG: hypothetical protein A2806_01230 [Candidatus Terrybacteria bacterium RIFCSPHIGHO2_01_FULL_48_17]
MKKSAVITIAAMGMATGMMVPVSAVANSNVVINEIAWMGTTTSTADEWIELANFGSESVDLSGWTIEAADGTPTILLSGTISARGYFLLERTDDETIPTITADQIYTGALSNSGEVLLLKDADNNTVQTIDAFSGWPAGDNTTKQTMERTASDNWQTSMSAGGTPKAPNSSVQQEEPPQEQTPPPPQEQEPPIPDPSSPDPAPTTDPEPPPDYDTTQVFLSELLPDPDGRDVENEFIEIVNTGTAQVDVSGWRLDDQDGNTTGPWTIPEGTSLVSGEYRAFYYSQTKLTLNNTDGDTVRLIDPSGQQHDAIRYNESAEGLALARFGDTWEWTSKPTPNAANQKKATGNQQTASGGETASAQTPPAQAPTIPAQNTGTISKSASPKTSQTTAPSLPSDAKPSTTDDNESEALALQAAASNPSSPLGANLPLIGAVALALLAGAGVVFYRIKL